MANRGSHLMSLKYATRVAIGFSLVAVMTAALAIAVVVIVWGNYFAGYTSQNVETIAQNTANRIALLCEDSETLDSKSVYPAEQSALVSPEVGVKVLDNDGNTFYDSAKDPIVLEQAEAEGKSAALLQPSDPEKIAMANIVVDKKVIGSVHVWVYGSNALMNKLDLEFRNNSLIALVVAAIIAVILSSIAGMFYSKRLVAPINKLSKTAMAVKNGDLSARVHFQGDSELANFGDVFDDMVDSLEKDRNMEQRLVSDVAHELRTPLMGIQSTVEAMIDGVYDTDEEHLELVNSEVQRLSRLVDALLKLSRLENRSQRMREEKVDLSELVHEIMMTHSLFVEDAGLELKYSTEPNVYVMGDSDMLRQVVMNLMSNAVRYTPEGGTVNIVVRRDGNYADIIVSDTGIGMSPEDVKMVFSRFWRAEEGRSRASGGLGVGLSIVKEIVEQHKGTITVESEQGVGTSFTVSLPMYMVYKEKYKENKESKRQSFGLVSNNPRKNAAGGGRSKPTKSGRKMR